MADISKPEALSVLIFGLDRVCGETYNFRNVDLDKLFHDLKVSEAALRATGAVNPLFYYCNIDLPHDVENLKKVVREGDAERGNRPWDAIGIGFGLRGHPGLTPLFEELLNYCVAHGRGARLTFTGKSDPDEFMRGLVRGWPHMKKYLSDANTA